jgi:hypothetical protein
MYVVENNQNFTLPNYVRAMPKSVSEFDEAWEMVAMIPRPAIIHLEQARFFVRFSQQTIEANDFGTETLEVTKRATAQLLRNNAAFIARACESLVEALDAEIIRALEMRHDSAR